jgi:hypothetical protein
MKSIIKMVALAGVIAAMSMGAGNALAQGRGGNFAQFRQDRLDRLKEKMGVTNDDEWKVIEGAVSKVMDAQRDVFMAAGGFGGFGGRGGRGGRGGGGGGTNNATADQGGQNGGRRGGGGGFGGGTPSPEREALQKAIDDNASSDVINAKLKALREANKAKEQQLEQAQADLRKLLTPKQEAVAVLDGVLR